MRECLQEGGNADNIHIQPTRAAHLCAFSGDYIPEDVHAVSIQNRNYIVWISVEAVDDFVRELERFNPDNPDDQNKIAQPDRYRDTKVSYFDEAIGGSTRCPVCCDTVGYRVQAYSMRQPRRNSEQVYVHRECRDGLIEALDRVWEHSELLAEHV